MLVQLKDLKSHPFRDFKIDPIDDDHVEVLRQSIQDYGFWGGVVCRKATNGDIQVIAGAHRVKAALAAGIVQADVVIQDMDDAQTIRLYAYENAKRLVR